MHNTLERRRNSKHWHARRHATVHFDMEKVLDRWEDLYRNLLQSPGARPNYPRLRSDAASRQAPDCQAEKS